MRLAHILCLAPLSFTLSLKKRERGVGVRAMPRLDTRWKNYAQEKNIPEATRIVAARNAYVFHFRGGTLDSANCKNGWLDCATWQVDHRPDMASEWFSPEAMGLERGKGRV